MPTIPLLRPERHWACPNCPVRSVTHEPAPHTRFHACGGLRGLAAPMVPAGQRVRVFAVERGDYVGREMAQTDRDGRPVMAVVTERWDGSNDCAVLAPTARGELEVA